MAARPVGQLGASSATCGAAQGDLAGALQAYEAGLAIAERLAGSDPGNAGWQRDLSVSWERVGGIREQQHDTAGALEAWRQALAVSLPLAKAHPDSVDLVTTPEVPVEGVARNLPDNDKAGREELAAQASDLLALLQPLADAGRLDAERAGWADDLKRVLAGLRGAPSSGAEPGK